MHLSTGDIQLSVHQPYDEPALLQRMRSGDTEAFARLYEQYHAGLYTYVLRFVKLPSLTEDLVHDVFVKIWDVRARINPESGLGGYLFRVTRNHVYKFIQRASRDQSVLQQLAAEMKAAGAGHQLLEDKEYDRLFRQALEQLPAQRRKVFELCRQEGKTYEEAAAILGISRNAIKKHMVLGVRAINEYIGRHGDIFLALYITSRLF